MGRYVVLLRAVNVGRTNRIPMASLRGALSHAGFADVATLLQSGNIVVGAEITDSEVKDVVENVICNQFHLNVQVLVRGAATIQSLVGSNPFSINGGDKANTYVTFLTREIDEDLVRSQIKRADREDEFIVRGREVIIYCHGPYHLTNLGNVFWERVGKCYATTRNWSTLSRIAELVVDESD